MSKQRVRGKIHDSDNKPLVGIAIEAFEPLFFGNVFDRPVAPAVFTDNDCAFDRNHATLC
ncbi:MAG: hypothetical protein WBZ20_04445 [Nitrososphaeraceae archaeon]